MSRTDEHDPQPLSEHEIERYMTAFQACLHVMDANPAEAARIGRLAGKTDAQTLGETPSASADASPPGRDLATLLAQPQSELEAAWPSRGEELWRLPTPPEWLQSSPGPMPQYEQPQYGQPVPPYQPERHPSLIAAQAELDGERIRGEAELYRARITGEAELVLRKAELDAEQRLAQAEIAVREERLDAERALFREAEAKEQEAASIADWQGPRAAPQRGWLMSAPVLVIAALAALSSGLWHGSLSPLVSIILASAAAASAVAYSAAILISALRLAFGSHRGPHPGAATALHLLVGAGSTRRGTVPPE